MIYFGLPILLGPLDLIPIHQAREWRNDYRVYRYCRQNDLLSDQDHLDWRVGYPKDGKTRMYSVCTLTEKPLGVAGLTSIDLINRRAEFSLYLDPKQRGCGHAKNGLMTLLSHAFSNLGLYSVWGEVFDYNATARTLFEKLGFKHDGTRRGFYFREGDFINAHIVSMLVTEWVFNNQFEGHRTQCSLPASA